MWCDQIDNNRSKENKKKRIIGWGEHKKVSKIKPSANKGKIKST